MIDGTRHSPATNLCEQALLLDHLLAIAAGLKHMVDSGAEERPYHINHISL